jgi:hypothetical protein
MAHNMTVTIEDSLWKEMKTHKEIRWSVVMKDAVERKLRAASLLENVSKGKQLSEEEITRIAIKLGKVVSGRK